ncbi:MAG: DegV family protein [Chloroflexi bacterium]|nr:MAG: DegV family protein [Chloroflexota bacterium]
MRIVMDDAGDVPPDLIKELNIRSLPVNIMFGSEAEYLTNVTLTREQFYEKAATVTAVNFPKSSQPTPYQFAEAYREIIAEGETEILTITVSEKLSGTYASAEAAGKELEGQGQFYLFDSQAGTAAQGYIVIEAARMARDGADINSIIHRLEQMRREMVVGFTIDSLEYARKGGRVSNVTSIMASLLNIKPILKLDDGLIVEDGRVRTRSKAINHIVESVWKRVGSERVKLAVMHGNSPVDAQILKQKAEKRLNTVEVIVVDMAISVAINLGPGALGIVAIPA